MHPLSPITWLIHLASVAEWAIALVLIWRFAEASGEPRWRGVAWAMSPALLGSLMVLAHHAAANDPALDWLGTLHAAAILGGNCALAAAAWRLAATSAAPAAPAGAPTSAGPPGAGR